MAAREISKHREDRALELSLQGLKAGVIGERLGVRPKRVHILIAKARARKLQRGKGTENDRED